MDKSTTNIKEAKARLSELIERARAGESVKISRRGKVVAQISSCPEARKPVDLNALRTLTKTLPRAEQDSETLIRRLRDGERY